MKLKKTLHSNSVNIDSPLVCSKIKFKYFYGLETLLNELKQDK